jgi:hypothetical protein
MTSADIHYSPLPCGLVVQYSICTRAGGHVPLLFYLAWTASIISCICLSCLKNSLSPDQSFSTKQHPLIFLPRGGGRYFPLYSPSSTNYRKIYPNVDTSICSWCQTGYATRRRMTSSRNSVRTVIGRLCAREIHIKQMHIQAKLSSRNCVNHFVRGEPLRGDQREVNIG